jgi:gluconokinase
MNTRQPQPQPLPTVNILAIDIGTSSIRVILFDADARPIPGAAVQMPIELQTSGEGGAEFVAPRLLTVLAEAIDHALRAAGDTPIAAVAMDTFVGNLLGVDGLGNPLTPLITYADTRNAEDAAALTAQLGEAGVAAAHDRTGVVIHAAYWPARLRWIARTRPDWASAVRRWVTLGDWLYFRFFGRWGCSYSVASWQGLLERRQLTWDELWQAALIQTPNFKLQTLFSPLIDIDQAYAGLQSEWAARWPQLANIPWLPAIGDGAAANLGSGCVEASRVALTIGTTGAVRVVVPPDLQQAPPGLWLYRVDRRRALLGGATSEGGNLFAWLRSTLQLPARAELEAALAAAQPAGHGLTVLPFIAGERAPGWRADARAVISGLTQHTRPVEIVQAALEGIAYRLAIIHDRLRPSLPVDHRIIASGGALLSSPAWMQMMADVLGRPLASLAEEEITARGVALLALEQLGAIESLAAHPVRIEKTYLPDAQRHRLHLQARARQEDIYACLLSG